MDNNMDNINTVEENGSKIGVISAGIAYLYAKEALGDKVDYLKLGMVYPLPEKKIIDFAKNYEKVYIIDELIANPLMIEIDLLNL